jgi:hypothetical protein
MSSHGSGPVVMAGTNHAGMVATRKGAAETAAAIIDFLGPN